MSTAILYYTTCTHMPAFSNTIGQLFQIPYFQLFQIPYFQSFQIPYDRYKHSLTIQRRIVHNKWQTTQNMVDFCVILRVSQKSVFKLALENTITDYRY